jgi:hypothetical protein
VSLLSKSEQGNEEAILAGRPAVLVAGTKEMHFEVTLDRAPLSMRCTVALDAANRLAMGGFKLGFDYDKWLGQHLLLSAYFVPTHRLIKTIVDRRPLILQCEIDGNVLFKAALNPDDLSPFQPFQGASQVLEFLACARTVARHLEVNPPVPRLEEIGPVEEDILYLWELIEYGEGTGTVKDGSAELELSVRELRRAFCAQSTGDANLRIQHVEVLEKCPPVFGCDTQKWALQRSIPMTLTAESARVLAPKKDENERIAVRIEAKAGTIAATKLVPMPTQP